MTEEKSLEEQIREKHLEVFGPESAERQEHRTQITRRLRALAVRVHGETAWKNTDCERAEILVGESLL